MKALFGKLFEPLNSVFKGAIVKRNSGMDVSLACNMYIQHTKDIARMQQETQSSISNQELQHAKEIEEKRQQLQMKLAYLSISHQEAIELGKKEFELALESKRQNFQEKMENLKFTRQIQIENFRKEFELKKSELDKHHQIELTKYTKEVDISINNNSLNFQKWKLEQELDLQKKLSLCNQKIQIYLAAYHRETMFLSPEIDKVYENWPLTLAPSQILNSQDHNDLIPLRVVIAPPEIKCNSFDGLDNINIPNLDRRLSEDLGQFLNLNYPLGDPKRPVEFLDGAWSSKNFRGGASIKSLFGLLKSEPMLILESEIDGKFINFRIAYWGLGNDNYCYERIISRLSCQDILYESAKLRAMKWRDDRCKLLEKGFGNNLDEIDKKYKQENNSFNLKQLEEENKLRHEGFDYEQIISYRISADDWEFFCKFLVFCHCLTSSYIIDAHYLIHHDVDPLMPEIISDIFIDRMSTLASISDIMKVIVKNYKNLFDIIKIERQCRVPDLSLQLAKCLANLDEKELACEMLNYSVSSRIEL